MIRHGRDVDTISRSQTPSICDGRAVSLMPTVLNEVCTVSWSVKEDHVNKVGHLRGPGLCRDYNMAEC